MQRERTAPRLHLLTAREIQAATDGDHSDGAGLSIRVRVTERLGWIASWVDRFTAPSGRCREMGLGVALRSNTALAGGGVKTLGATPARPVTLLQRGVDPIDERAHRRVGNSFRLVTAATFLRRIVLSAVVALGWPLASRAAARAPEDLVLVRQGTLPIVLTAPHGGRLDIPGVAPRSAPDSAHTAAFAKWGGFHRGGDANTDALTLRIAAEIEKLTGRGPYVVLARFRRRFVDANRPAELAYVDPAAAPYYALYQGTIREFVGEIRRTYPAGLLLDVHGEAKDPDVLMRGTSNGDTVTRLVRRGGTEAITGPNGLFGQFETQGFKVFPSNRSSTWRGSENGGYNGGYTVHTYGSHNPEGIDAVQLEFGMQYRRDDALDKTAAQAARAIVTFYKAWLSTAARERR
jgi:N-formylglutamate amidohydrolase